MEAYFIISDMILFLFFFYGVLKKHFNDDDLGGPVVSSVGSINKILLIII